MLKVLRDNLKYLSWILWVVILVFIAFVFVDFGGARLGRGGTNAAATVGDQQVSYADYQRTYRRMEESYRRMFGERYTPELGKQMQLPLHALEQLVAQRILLQEAERLGISASDEEVRRTILEDPSLKDESGAFIGPEIYEQLLRSEGYTATQYEHYVRDQLIVRKLASVVGATVHVSDREVEAAYRERNEKAKIRYLFVPGGRYASQAQATPAEVASYFDAHKEAFRLPVQRVVSYLLIDSSRLRAQQRVEPAEVAKYYQDHLDEFHRDDQVHARHILLRVDDKRPEAQAKQEITAIQGQLARGADFAALAREKSDDPGSKANGGDLGFFTHGRMIKEFEEAAFGAETGKVVGPVRTSFGFHLIQVLERRAAGSQPLAEVEGTIRFKLINERVEKLAEAKVNELAAKIRSEKRNSAEQLKALVEGDLVSWQTTTPFGADEPVPGIGRGTPFSTAAFALTPGAPSDPVKIQRGWAILLLGEERPARLPNLAEVEPRVRQAAGAERQSALAKSELERARVALAGGLSLEKIAQGLGLQAPESQPFGPGAGVPGLAGSEPVAKAAFELSAGQIGGPVAIANGAVLFQVIERQRFDPQAFAAARESTRLEIAAREQQALLAALVNQRKLDLKVTYDRSLVRELGLTESSATSGP